MARRKTVERFVNGAVGDEQPSLLDAPKGWQQEWVGLPEFMQLQREPYALIHVRFATAEDLAEFSKLVDQKVNRTTKAIWFPEIVKGIHSKHEYVKEMAESVAHGDRDTDSFTHDHDDMGAPDPRGTETQASFTKKPRHHVAQQSLFRGEDE